MNVSARTYKWVSYSMRLSCQRRAFAAASSAPIVCSMSSLAVASRTSLYRSRCAPRTVSVAIPKLMHFHPYLDDSPSTLHCQVGHRLAERLRLSDDSVRVPVHEAIYKASCKSLWGCKTVPL